MSGRLGTSASFLSFVVLMLFCSTAQARTWYVPSEYPTIHAGLDSASYGDTVLVAPGTYYRTEDPETRINPGPGVHLVSQSGPDVTTIESCSGVGVKFENSEGASLSGFTVRYGPSPDCEPLMAPGSAVYCFECTDVIVENCILEHTSYGIKVNGASQGWWKPVFRNNTIRDCVAGIYCTEVYEPERPLFQGNFITQCNRGAEIWNSSPSFDANRIVNNREWGAEFFNHCGGNWTRNVIAYNVSGGVYVNVDPPLATPDFNGGWEDALANDFYGNGGFDISYIHGGGLTGPLMAIYNYWGSRCPDFEHKLNGDVKYSPWVDSTHTERIYVVDCPGATEPSTWGSIKALFR